LKLEGLRTPDISQKTQRILYAIEDRIILCYLIRVHVYIVD
jgi:hypothetical protein